MFCAGMDLLRSENDIIWWGGSSIFCPSISIISNDFRVHNLLRFGFFVSSRTILVPHVSFLTALYLGRSTLIEIELSNIIQNLGPPLNCQLSHWRKGPECDFIIFRSISSPKTSSQKSTSWGIENSETSISLQNSQNRWRGFFIIQIVTGKDRKP